MGLYARKDRERSITEAINELSLLTLLGESSPFKGTPHPPGSPGKIAMLAQRFDLEMDLFHPEDESRKHDTPGASGAAWLVGEAESTQPFSEYDLEDEAA